MDQAHLHLLINHLSIFGSLLGGLVLLYGVWTRSSPTKIAAYYVLVIAAVGGGIAYLTGEGAEETVENIPGIAKSMIELHEEFALIALVSLLIMGVASLFGIFLTYRNSSFARPVALGILITCLVSFGLVARTGYLGGQIRHTEISSSSSLPAQEVEGKVNDDD